MAKENIAYLGDAIKSARKSIGMTQLQLSERLHITPRHLKAIENRWKNPSYSLFVRILHELDISADMVFYHNRKDKKSVTKIFPFHDIF